jgi:Tol biopolymer transport system component/DNA-binding winged helix-turn-helix (wHTH) protein
MSLNLTSNYLEIKIAMAKSSKHAVYEFDEFRLDAVRLMLYRAGQEISLPPKVVETLVVLVENQGQIIGKEDLMNKLWADAAVEESNLSQCLYRLRKTLGERADGSPYIETLRRRGYRFNGAARPVENRPEENGFAPSAAHPQPPPQQPKIFASPRYDVERHGNVLKVADWREAEIPAEETETKIEEAVHVSPTESFPVGKAATIVAGTVILLALFSLAWYKFLPLPAELAKNAKKELTIVRLTNGTAPLDAAISPDGDYFVYHEQDGGTTARLWLQQTEQSNRIAIIPPSERIFYGKTFSPDGKFIYFVAQDKLDAPAALYRVPTLGGPESKISDRVDSPVSFSPDGRRMVFRRLDEQTRESSLIIAASSGGDEKILLARASSDGLLGLPEWSPDGNLIAFGATDARNVCRINGINLQTGAIETLSPEKLDNCYRIAWTRDGQGLVFVGTKYAEGHSTRRDQIYYLSLASGETRRLTTDGNRHQPASLGITDNDEILAVPFNRSSQIWQMNPNGDSRTAVQITNGLADGRAGLATLADGRIAYIARVGENLSVWLADADGQEQKQITYDPPFVEEVRGSPDGGFLVFSAAAGDQRSHLFRMDADGANLRQLTFGNSYNSDSTVSPDGNWIVYASQSRDKIDAKHSLLKIPSAGGEPVLLSDTDCYAPKFSPDGQFISCVRGAKFIIISAADGSVVKTFEPVKIPHLSVGAHWSPDGRELIYIAHQKGFSNLWRQPLDGGEPPRPLTDFTSGEIHNLAFSADGSRLYVARGYQLRDAVLIKNFR